MRHTLVRLSLIGACLVVSACANHPVAAAETAQVKGQVTESGAAGGGPVATTESGAPRGTAEDVRDA